MVYIRLDPSWIRRWLEKTELKALYIGFRFYGNTEIKVRGRLKVVLSFWFPTFSDMILFVWKISLLGHIDGESADNPEHTLVSSVSIREEGVGYVF